jgi:hypothetical protein
MRAIAFAALTAAALGATACSGPYKAPVADADDNVNTEKVILLDRYVAPRILPDRLEMLNYRFGPGEEGKPVVSCDLVSRRSSKNLRFDVRAVFKDRTGAIIDESAWSPVILAPGATYSYRAIGIRDDSSAAQIQIRRLR